MVKLTVFSVSTLLVEKTRLETTKRLPLEGAGSALARRLRETSSQQKSAPPIQDAPIKNYAPSLCSSTNFRVCGWKHRYIIGIREMRLPTAKTRYSGNTSPSRP